MVSTINKRNFKGIFKGCFAPRKLASLCIVSSDFFRSHEPHTRLSAALTAALYYRIKDKRLLPPAATGYLQLTIYSSMFPEGR